MPFRCTITGRMRVSSWCIDSAGLPAFRRDPGPYHGRGGSRSVFRNTLPHLRNRAASLGVAEYATLVYSSKKELYGARYPNVKTQLGKGVGS